MTLTRPDICLNKNVPVTDPHLYSTNDFHSGRLDYGLPKSRNNCHFTSKISLLFDLGVRLLAV